MAFELALKRAQELGGDTVRFAQTIDCCTGFTARWIKCQFLGQDFWANANPFKAPIVTPSFVDVPLKGGGSLTTRQAVMTADGNAKITGIYSRIDQSRANRGKAGQGTTEYLAGSNKMDTTR